MRRRLQFLIQLQQLRRLRRPKVKKDVALGNPSKRDGYGAFENLLNVLLNDRELFFRYIRMTLERFNNLSLVKKQIEKKELVFVNPFPLPHVWNNFEIPCFW